MRVGIVGSRQYTDRIKIKNFIFKLKEQYEGSGKLNEGLIIVSGGCKNGADKFAKKYALELDINYEEYPPFHDSYNLYCVLPERLYGKPYHVSNYFARNKLIAKNSDMVVGFIPEGVRSNGTMSTIKYAKSFNKKTLIIM